MTLPSKTTSASRRCFATQPGVSSFESKQMIVEASDSNDKTTVNAKVHTTCRCFVFIGGAEHEVISVDILPRTNNKNILLLSAALAAYRKTR